VKALLLRLEGPLQAWSTQSKLGIRDTDREPSKSAVLGLVGAALGMERDDDEQLARLRALSMAVRVDRPGSLLRDYHTAGGGRFRGRTDYFVFGEKNCVPSDRYYLQGACFTVALAGEASLVEQVGAAVRSPRWPIFLGRRSCPPSTPPFLAIVDGDAHSAVAGAPLLAEGERWRQEPRRLRLVVEALPEDGGEPRYDEPLSFRAGNKRYGIRYVRTAWLDRPVAEAEPEGPEGVEGALA
jgi:CRISPR system Cascade subunit CasD